MPTSKTKTKKAVTTTDVTEPITITDKVILSMLRALGKSQRKSPETYLNDLVRHHFLYL